MTPDAPLIAPRRVPGELAGQSLSQGLDFDDVAEAILRKRGKWAPTADVQGAPGDGWQYNESH